jgi:hypothetical protein
VTAKPRPAEAIRGLEQLPSQSFTAMAPMLAAAQGPPSAGTDESSAPMTVTLSPAQNWSLVGGFRQQPTGRCTVIFA